MTEALRRWKDGARELKKDIYTLYYAYKDPRVPWYAKVLAAAVVAYAASPIDLIPDFIPIFGYLDDLVILPLGIIVALKAVPRHVLAECRDKAQIANNQGTLKNWFTAFVIIAIWIFVGILVVRFLVHTW
ncbi:MAG: YkvA family protein [candidate division WOR-3 bacterium]